MQPEEVEWFGLTEGQLMERFFRCHGRGMEVELELEFARFAVVGWRRSRVRSRVWVTKRPEVERDVLGDRPSL